MDNLGFNVALGCVAVMVVATAAARPAMATEAVDTPLVLRVASGESVTDVLVRCADQVRAFVPDEGPWRDMPASELARELLHSNLGHLPHGIHTGNHVEIAKSGEIRVTAGEGKAPQPFANEAQMRALLAAAPEAVHEQMEALSEMGGLRTQPFTISAEGRAVTIADKTYTAGPGILFQGRTSHFHVVGDKSPIPFTVTVWPLAGMAFSFPHNPYFRATPEGVIELKVGADSGLAQLLASAQIHAHDEHYHLTRTYAFAPWQEIVKLSAGEGNEVDRQKKTVATGVQVRLLGEHVYISMTQFARDIAALNEHISRAWQAISTNLEPSQVGFLVRYNAAIEGDGKLFKWDAVGLNAGEGLHFTVCAEHLHVVGGLGSGIDVAIAPPATGKTLRVPTNVFIGQEGTNIVPRQFGADLARLLKDGVLHASNGTYHLTDKLAPEVFAAVDALVADKDTDAAVRTDLRAQKDAILNDAAPIGSEAELMRFVHTREQRLKRLRHRVEAALPASDVPAPTGN